MEIYSWIKLNYLVVSRLLTYWWLTVDGDEGGLGDSLPGHVPRDAAVVGGVRELGLGHQEIPRARDDEVGVLHSVDLLAVPEPAEDGRLGPTLWRMTS